MLINTELNKFVYSTSEDPEKILHEIEQVKDALHDRIVHLNALITSIINPSEFDDSDWIFEEKCKMINGAARYFEVVEGSLSVRKAQVFALLYEVVLKEKQMRQQIKLLLIEQLNKKFKMVKDKKDVLRMVRAFKDQSGYFNKKRNK